MSREWKPGDVAAFVIDGEWVHGIRTTDGTWTAYAPGLASGEVRSWIDRPWDGLHGQRPLVVLDLSEEPSPEDKAGRTEAERLVHMLRETADSFFVPDAAELARKVANQIADQIANPTPRIEEPKGLGAVVEDADGADWHRTRDGRWIAEDGLRSRACGWSHLSPVRVLSEGVIA